jgi:hypothetical protein
MYMYDIGSLYIYIYIRTVLYYRASLYDGFLNSLQRGV